MDRTDLAALFAAKDTPSKVGRLAGKLLDTTDLKAGDINDAKDARLEELRKLNDGGSVGRTQADRIDTHLRDVNRSRRIR